MRGYGSRAIQANLVVRVRVGQGHPNFGTACSTRALGEPIETKQAKSKYVTITG